MKISAARTREFSSIATFHLVKYAFPGGHFDPRQFQFPVMASIDPVAQAAAKNSQAVNTTEDGASSVMNEDDRDLLKLGYRSVLARGWGSFDNFACSFSALYCIGGIRVSFYIALAAGGPAAM